MSLHFFYRKCHFFPDNAKFLESCFSAGAPGGRSEGANLDRHLVPYHVKQGESNLASSLFIYVFIYIHQPR